MSTTSVDLHSHGGHGGTAMASDPHHQHHFATMEQQFDTAKLGMWLFLATEILLFGGLFVGFGMMQSRYPREFVEAHEHLVRWQGSLNTVILLISSFTMVMAVQCGQDQQEEEDRVLPGADHCVRLRLPGGEIFRVCPQIRGRLAAGQVL